MKYFNKNIFAIFIMLGSGCNFQCRYCMQHTESAELKPLPEEINEDIFEFIEEIADNQKSPLKIQFYGGEPLVYYDKLKYITEKLKHNKNINFCIISNGRAMTNEMVEYFNDNKFHIAISWDGSGTHETRKFDVFKDDLELRRRLLRIEHLGISAVFSSYVYPKQLVEDFQALDNEYKAIHGHHLMVNVDELFDTGMSDRSLFDIDYERFSEEIAEITEEVLLIQMNKLKISTEEFDEKYSVKMSLIGKFIGAVSEYCKNENIKKYINSCGNGYYVYNLDLEGNLYSCHNKYVTCGNIYSNYFEYLNNVIKHDDTKINYLNSCSSCEVYPICRGGCKLITTEAREETYCKLKKAVFGPTIKKLISIGENKNGAE